MIANQRSTESNLVYFNDRFYPKQDVIISPDDRGFLLADGVYEVVLSYGGKLFKFDEHLQRMQRGIRELRFGITDLGYLKDVAETLIRKNGFQEVDAKVYIQITRGVAPRSHAFPEPEVSPTIYAAASPFHLDVEAWQHGAHVLLVPDIRWARCDIKSIALLPNTLAFQQARDFGAHEAVFVRDGVITEGAHTNFCAVYDSTLVTAPRNNYILSGITRATVLDLCRELRIPVKEFPVFERDLPHADECLIVGTTTEITPVVRINDRKVGDGTPGPITRALQQAFRKLVKVPKE
jgi:D-alanine transaminase